MASNGNKEHAGEEQMVLMRRRHNKRNDGSSSALSCCMGLFHFLPRPALDALTAAVTKTDCAKSLQAGNLSKMPPIVITAGISASGVFGKRKVACPRANVRKARSFKFCYE